MFVLLLGLQIALAEAAAVAAGRSLLRRVACAALLVAGLPLALLLSSSYSPLARATLSFMSLVAIMSSTRIILDARPWPLSRRVWQALMFFDVRDSRPASHGCDGRRLAIAVLYLALLGGTIALLAAMQRQHGAIWMAARLLCGAVLMYAVLEVVSSVSQFVHRLFGIAAPPIQKTPLVSRTVAEFWSERWDPAVGHWLSDLGFRPLARRGHVLLGVVATFLISAAIHGWLYGVTLGWWAAASAISFFVLQVPVLWAERRLAVRRWPAAGARAWTLGVLLASSPLFVAPLLVGIGANL